MKRGEIVSVADPSGDFSGKPRPALIVQSELFLDEPASVTVCLITSRITGLHLFRIPIAADAQSGLRDPSEVAVDKVQSVWSHRIGRSIGNAPDDVLFAVDQALRRWLAL